MAPHIDGVTTVLLSGASGFIGRALAASLAADDIRLIRLSRRASPDGIAWDPERGQLDTAALERASPDVVINLAGEPIAHRWTAERKRRIRESRINGTTALSRALAGLARKPRAFVSGSAVGYYGVERGDEILTESSSGGSDFLAHVTRDWEAATSEAGVAGIRVVTLRTGVVTGRGGGALARMLPPFEAGVGGPLGSGRQWMSWISLTDTIRAIRFAADTDAVTGPVNVVAPEPVRNSEFARVLGHVLHRPAAIPAPRLALTLLFGEMAEQTILASQRAIPEKLTGAGFEFRHPRLEEALRFELRRSGDPAAR